MSDVYDKLTSLLQDVFDDDDIVATPDLAAADVDGWDSLAHVRVILAVEKAFNVKFKAAEINVMKNVGDLANSISAKLAGG
ncbi:MAG: acyl carrier protein [Alphaproteobacteria bacterium]|nr:acyl carrier protein [Alphaproteobacteria bacterium]